MRGNYDDQEVPGKRGGREAPKLLQKQYGKVEEPGHYGRRPSAATKRGEKKREDGKDRPSQLKKQLEGRARAQDI